MISASIGLGVALLIIVFAKFTQFERDRAFFPTILIIIASYYILFSIMAAHSLTQELIVASGFLFIAVFGSYKSLTLIACGIMGHGIYDIFHFLYLNQSVAPQWWPSFCAVVDLTLGLWVFYLTKSRHLQVKKDVT